MQWEYAELYVSTRLERTVHVLQHHFSIRVDEQGKARQLVDDETMHDPVDNEISQPAVFKLDTAILSALNLVGREGWEVYNVEVEKTFSRDGVRGYSNTSDWISRTYMLKRPKQE